MMEGEYELPEVQTAHDRCDCSEGGNNLEMQDLWADWEIQAGHLWRGHS